MTMDPPDKVINGDYDDAANSSIVIVTATRGDERPHESRLALLDKNVRIIRDIVEKLKAADFDGILVMTTNPVGVLSTCAVASTETPRRAKSTRQLITCSSGVIASTLHTPLDFALRRTRTGLGLFTTETIKAGRRVIEYQGEVISAQESERRGGKYLFQLDERRVIDGRARSNLARYINHACRPNAVGYAMRGKVWIYAARIIRAGEQITIDYGAEYFGQHIAPRRCRCDGCVAPPGG